MRKSVKNLEDLLPFAENKFHQYKLEARRFWGKQNY